MMQTPATVSSEVTKELDAVIHLQSGKNRYLMASKNFSFLSWIRIFESVHSLCSGTEMVRS